MAEHKAPDRSAGGRTPGAAPEVEFDQVVTLLREVWTLRRNRAFHECVPCQSGLDRGVLEDPTFQGFGR
jgi:hypothetical protein